MFRYLILGLLRHGAALHGYALIQSYCERSGVQVRTGNFYRELSRLLGEGLIYQATKPRGGDARRVPYAITEKGCEVFDAWLTAPTAGYGEQTDDDISARIQYLVELEPERAGEVLEHLRVNLWTTSKRAERARAVAQRGAADHPDDKPAAVLPLLLLRRMKQLAIDLELVESVRAVLPARAAAAQRPRTSATAPVSAARGER